MTSVSTIFSKESQRSSIAASFERVNSKGGSGKSSSRGKPEEEETFTRDLRLGFEQPTKLIRCRNIEAETVPEVDCARRE